MSRSLERNPIGWLHQHTWIARTTKWFWLLLVVILNCVWLQGNQFYNFEEKEFGLAALLLVSLSLTSAGSFHLERETGAMELLLVTPLSNREIIFGRLRGIWGQYLPAMLLLLLACGSLYFDQIWRNLKALMELDHLTGYLTMGILFWAIPWAGFHFSLSRRTFVGAWLWTILHSVVGRLFVYALIGFFSANVLDIMFPKLVLVLAVMEAGITHFFYQIIQLDLRGRRFITRPP
jgi:hypothetical protein